MKPFVLMSLFFSISIHAGEPSGPTTPGKILWNAWYTIKIYDNIPFSYYNETVEDRGDQIHFQQKMWKKEKESITEEHIGLTAKNNKELTPILFNFFRTDSPTRETIIDGTMNDKNVLHIKLRESASVRTWNRTLPKETFLSTFFPVWVSKHWKEFKEGKKLYFRAIIEDNYASDFPVSNGWVRLEKQDIYSKKNGTEKFTINFRDASSIWWIKPTGQALQIEMPTQNAVVDITTEEKAKSFLTKK